MQVQHGSKTLPCASAHDRGTGVVAAAAFSNGNESSNRQVALDGREPSSTRKRDHPHFFVLEPGIVHTTAASRSSAPAKAIETPCFRRWAAKPQKAENSRATEPDRFIYSQQRMRLTE